MTVKSCIFLNKKNMWDHWNISPEFNSINYFLTFLKNTFEPYSLLASRMSNYHVNPFTIAVVMGTTPNPEWQLGGRNLYTCVSNEK